MRYRVILAHGFGKSYRDMEPLEKNLTALGYEVDNLNFPLTFPAIEKSAGILRGFLLDLKERGLSDEDEIVLIGYGLGGVLIEKTLADPEVRDIVDKILLIASPVRDSVIRRRIKRIFPLLDKIFKPLKALKKGRKFAIDNPRVEIGVIIGTEPCGFFKKWLGEYSDGVLSRKECELDTAKDTLVLPLVHKEIHKKPGTAKYISEFITKGKFRVYTETFHRSE
ncbi:MAG: alpha/beta hydrolase [Fusobacteriaceae bacterium]|jgi:pimeloyl-ACP methyl ester carboxylesterase|nr:alpha/beta hydrolase [Fusobacteriaceae bacterium]